jgi:hypothetical protein
MDTPKGAGPPPSIGSYRKGCLLVAFAESAINAGNLKDAERLISLAYRQFDAVDRDFANLRLTFSA